MPLLFESCNSLVLLSNTQEVLLEAPKTISSHAFGHSSHENFLFTSQCCSFQVEVIFSKSSLMIPRLIACGLPDRRRSWIISDNPGYTVIYTVIYPDTLLFSADVQPLRNVSLNMSGGQQSGVFQFSLIPLRCEEI